MNKKTQNHNKSNLVIIVFILLLIALAVPGFLEIYNDVFVRKDFATIFLLAFVLEFFQVMALIILYKKVGEMNDVGGKRLEDIEYEIMKHHYNYDPTSAKVTSGKAEDQKNLDSIMLGNRMAENSLIGGRPFGPKTHWFKKN